MARPTIGLDIGTSAVRAAEVRVGDPPTLMRFAQIALPPGAVVAGEINDDDGVTAAIRELWRRGEFRSKRVAVAVANQSVIVRPLELPHMPEADLRGALPYQVQDYLPIPVEEALLDFLMLDEFISSEDVQMMRVLTVAANRQMIDRFIAVVTGAGLDVVSVDIAPLAAVRALVEPIPAVLEERGAEAVVDIGAGVTNVVVHEHGTPRFVRILSAGGADITAALSAGLGLSPEDAEARKVAVGVPAEGATPEQGASTIVDQRARAFLDDVQRSLEYYASQPGVAPLTRVVLAGGGAQLAGMDRRMASALSLPVSHGDPLARLQVGETGLGDEQLRHVSAVGAVAIGLAMEE